MKHFTFRIYAVHASRSRCFVKCIIINIITPSVLVRIIGEKSPHNSVWACRIHDSALPDGPCAEEVLQEQTARMSQPQAIAKADVAYLCGKAEVGRKVAIAALVKHGGDKIKALQMLRAREAFDAYEFDRLQAHGAEDMDLVETRPTLTKVFWAQLDALIAAGKLFSMDAESGVAIPVDIVVGFDGGSVLLVTPR